MTTYKEYFQRPTLHKEIRELLDELNKIQGERWECEEYEYSYGLFGKKKAKSYKLYKQIQGCEWQVINFYLSEEAWIKHPFIPVEIVVNFLVGYLAGLTKQNYVQEN